MIRENCKIFLPAITSLGLVFASFGVSNSAELLMLEQVGCYWCEKWDEEIGEIYPKTNESKIAPLRKVDIDDKWPTDLKDIAIDQFTPTFVVVEDAKEIGRLRGYPGDQFFWPLLNEILDKLPKNDTSG